MNISAARTCAALLAACAAVAPTLAMAGQTLLGPRAEPLTDEQSAVLRVFVEDPYGLAVNETVIEAVGTAAGQWTRVDDMPARRNPNRTVRRHPGEDLVISLAPGSYLLKVACYGDFEHRFDAHPVEVAAGREYRVDCRGRSEADARLRISDQPALPFKAIRPVRTALVDLPAGFEPVRIGEAVKAALAYRGWEVLDEASGRIDAIHRDAKFSASTRIQYDPKEVSFTFLEGTNHKPHVEDGETAVRFPYYYWIRFLGQDIGRHLVGEPLTD